VDRARGYKVLEYLAEPDTAAILLQIAALNEVIDDRTPCHLGLELLRQADELLALAAPLPRLEDVRGELLPANRVLGTRLDDTQITLTSRLESGGMDQRL
jgi:hypothetical protein